METLSSLNPANALIMILALIGGGWLLFKVASKLIRTVGVILIALLVWYFWQGGTVKGLQDKSIEALFGDTPIGGLHEKYCKTGKEDRVRCACVVKPVYDDLLQQHGAEKVLALDRDPDARREALQASTRRVSAQIRNCIVNQKGAQGAEELRKLLDEAAPAASDTNK